MRALIIEDEMMAAKALQKLIREVSPDTEIVGVLESIEESVEWLENNPMPDLMFMDIHLADGSSFAIFERVNVTCPVIFTTAYDEFALKAFEVNSLDYLLKPISKESLERAMSKFQALIGTRFNTDKIERLLEQLGEKKKHRSYFLLPERDKLVPLSTKDIAYAYIDAKSVKIVTHEHKNYYLTHTLDDLMAPHLLSATRRHIDECRGSGAALCFLDMPLLYEKGYDRLCDAVWVVWLPENVQLSRLISRDGFTREEAISRIRAVLSSDEKAALADRVIDNSGSVENTYGIVSDFLSAEFAASGNIRPARLGENAAEYT